VKDTLSKMGPQFSNRLSFNVLVILGVLLGGNFFTPTYANNQLTITLDKESDVQGVWNGNSCHYSDHPDDDLWVYGCPVTVPGDIDLSSSGYWSLCLPSTTWCRMDFDAGYLPKATTLRVRAFIQG